MMKMKMMNRAAGVVLLLLMDEWMVGWMYVRNAVICCVFVPSREIIASFQIICLVERHNFVIQQQQQQHHLQ